MHFKQRHNAISFLIVATFILSFITAAGAVFLKYHLQNAREHSLQTIKAHTGIDFNVTSVETEGLRSLTLSELSLLLPLGDNDKLHMRAQSVKLALSIPAMIRGKISVGDAVLEGVKLVYFKGSSSQQPKPQKKPFLLPPDLLERLPFQRLSGSDCSLEIRQDDKSILSFDSISFSLTNDSGKGALLVALETAFSVGASAGKIKVAGDLQLPGHVRGEVHFDGINGALLRHFTPVPDGLDGALEGNVSFSGDTEKSLLVETTLDISRFTFPDLPAAFSSINGALRSVIQWSSADKQLRVLSGDLSTDLLNLKGQGVIDFSADSPQVQASVTGENLPLSAILAEYLPKTLNRLGKPVIHLSGNEYIVCQVTGALEHPSIKVEAAVPEITLALQPSNKEIPEVAFRLQQIRASWDSVSAVPELSALVSDGSIKAAKAGFEATQVSGVISLHGKTISLQPFSALLAEKDLYGSATYDLEKEKAEFKITGELSALENTILKDSIKNLKLAGDIAFHASGTYLAGGPLTVKASADVTRGMVAFEWWLKKPVGVGATIKSLNAEILPGKSMTITGEAFVEDTKILADLKYRYSDDKKWENTRTRVDLPHLEVNSAGKCVDIPYTALGGACKNGFYESNYVGPLPGDSIAKLGGHFDHVSFFPDGGIHPLDCTDTSVEVTITTIKNKPKTTEFVIHAGDAKVPPFSEKWILPMGAKEEEQDSEEKPSEPTFWIFNLSADSISLPPWQGKDFSGQLHDNPDETYFSFFRGKMGDGQVNGTYHHEKRDNIMTLKGNWEDIPAVYLIRHLELPEILEGNCTGTVSYTVDQDDPGNTLETEGSFSVTNGHFIEHKLYEVFTSSFAQKFGVLPPAALRFKKLSSDLKIKGDQIFTDNVSIESDGMTITGHGIWILEGDMNYRIDLSMSPDLAEQISIMRESFNIQGFRMTQRNIELGFQLSGPTFNPTSELAGLPPIGVTFVSGAADLTGEAMKLLDTPRQMFMSIFRSGGGILGATRTQTQQ